MATPSRTITAESAFELYSWYFMRLSGIVLFILALGHLIIMHVINTVENIDDLFVAERLSNPFWQIYDWVLLTLALLHGLNGIRIIIDDYVHRPGLRMALQSCLYIIAFLFFVAGSMVIWTFPSYP